MSDVPPKSHYSAVVIGGGQAGLSASHYLKAHGIDHVVFEKKTVAHKWKNERWDAFCLVTPNWQCQLPGHPYDGKDPHGFMVKDEILGYVDRFVAKSVRRFWSRRPSLRWNARAIFSASKRLPEP